MEEIPDPEVKDIIWEGARANRTISTISGSKANGQTVDFIDVPDWDARHKFLTTILKLKGRLKDNDSDSGEVTINIINFNNPAIPVQSTSVSDSPLPGAR